MIPIDEGAVGSRAGVRRTPYPVEQFSTLRALDDGGQRGQESNRRNPRMMRPAPPVSQILRQIQNRSAAVPNTPRAANVSRGMMLMGRFCEGRGGDSHRALRSGTAYDAWNAQDLDAIVAMHAPDMVFANHTAGESASGEEVRGHIAKIFEAWPDMRFETRRLYVREGVVTQEWTATATHSNTLRRGDLEAPPSGRDRQLGRRRRDPLRGRLDQAQGRLLGLGLDPAPGRPARLSARHRPQRRSWRRRLRRKAGQARGRRADGEDDRRRVEVGDAFGGEAVLAEDDAVDRVPGDRLAAGGAAEGELDQDAVLGRAPAVHLRRSGRGSARRARRRRAGPPRGCG